MSKVHPYRLNRLRAQRVAAVEAVRQSGPYVKETR